MHETVRPSRGDDRTVSVVLVVLGQRRLTLILTVSSADSVRVSPL